MTATDLTFLYYVSYVSLGLYSVGMYDTKASEAGGNIPIAIPPLPRVEQQKFIFAESRTQRRRWPAREEFRRIRLATKDIITSCIDKPRPRSMPYKLVQRPTATTAVATIPPIHPLDRPAPLVGDAAALATPDAADVAGDRVDVPDGLALTLDAVAVQLTNGQSRSVAATSVE